MLSIKVVEMGAKKFITHFLIGRMRHALNIFLFIFVLLIYVNLVSLYCTDNCICKYKKQNFKVLGMHNFKYLFIYKILGRDATTGMSPISKKGCRKSCDSNYYNGCRGYMISGSQCSLYYSSAIVNRL